MESRAQGIAVIAALMLIGVHRTPEAVTNAILSAGELLDAVETNYPPPPNLGLDDLQS